MTRSGSIISISLRRPRKSAAAAGDEEDVDVSIAKSALIKPTFKRYIILFLFGLNSGNKAFQWIQIPASTAKITHFYDVENFVVNSLSVLFMLAFVVLSWPSCYVINKIGIRKAVLIGAFGTGAGAVIKCFSCHEGGIYLLCLGQIVVSLSEQFIFSVPSRLASVWFPDNEVSSAVAMCILGNQIGNALGFIVPQILLDSAETKEEIGSALYAIFFGLAAISLIAFVADVILFDEAPKYAPGAARLKQIEQEEANKELKASFGEEMEQLLWHTKELLKNRDYNILSVVYGIMIGANYALATVLNQMLEPLWPGDDILVGNTGSLMIISGVLGLPLWGRLMDRLHRYLYINMFLTLATLLSFALFAYAVSYMHSAYAVYLGALLIGLFQTGIMASALEFAVELTYPAPELISSSIMNVQPQVFGTLLVYAASYIVDSYGALATNFFFVLVCLVAFILLPFIRENLRRQTAIAEEAAAKGKSAVISKI